MMLIPKKNKTGAQGMLERRGSGILCNEGGFVLAFVMFLLAVCTLLGLAASQTSIDETDISSNEVITRKVYTMALSGLPLAAIPLLTTQGRGVWIDEEFLDNADPLLTASACPDPTPPGCTDPVIQILDGSFLSEGREEDPSYDTGWNNAGKYLCNNKDAAYKPIDDPFQQRKADGTLYDTSIGDIPDIRIRSDNQLTLDIDVDKSSVGYQAGGVTEFGSGAEGSAGTAYQLNYVMDCKATIPGKEIGENSAPTAEIILGYRFIPDSGM